MSDKKTRHAKVSEEDLCKAQKILNARESETTLTEYISAMQILKRVGCGSLQDVFDWLDAMDAKTANSERSAIT